MSRPPLREPADARLRACRCSTASVTPRPGTRATSTLRACPSCGKASECGALTLPPWRRRYVYAGGFPYDLTEGDLLAVFSQVRELLRPALR